MKKKILSVIALCLALAVVFPFAAFAAEPLTDEEPAAAESFDSIPDDMIVAKLYICTQQVGFGHSWIYIENLCGSALPVGAYTLQPDAGVSMGTFGVSRADGAGLYYNIEAYCANKWGLKNQAWLGTEITKEQLVSVSTKIANWNHWDLFFNCSYFAADIWNTVSDKKIVPLVFPAFEKWQILSKGGNKDIEMKEVTSEECFKQKGNGANASLKQVSEKSVSSKLL